MNLSLERIADAAAATDQQTSKGITCQCRCALHPLHSSCIQCGWLCCEQNNHMTECAFCSALLVAPLSAEDVRNAAYDEFVSSMIRVRDESTLKAYELKDKLLLFDKEHAKRTQVRDAQGDYYSSGTWLTEEEKQDIARRESKRRALVQQHSKFKVRSNVAQKVNILFDSGAVRSNRHIVEYEEGEEDSIADPAAVEEASNERNDFEQPEVDLSAYRFTDAATGKMVSLDSGARYTAVVGDSSADQMPVESTGNVGEAAVVSGEMPSVYENTALECSAGRAGQFYRYLKKHWEEEEAQRSNYGKSMDVYNDRSKSEARSRVQPEDAACQPSSQDSPQQSKRKPAAGINQKKEQQQSTEGAKTEATSAKNKNKKRAKKPKSLPGKSETDAN